MNSRDTMVVNVDLDGVIYPWHEQFAKYVGNVRSRPNRDYEWWKYSNTDAAYPEPTMWDFWEEWGLTKADFKALFRGAVREGVVWGEGRPLPDAQWLMGKLADQDYYVRIVTTRLFFDNTFGRVQHLTADWLDEWAIPYREIAYVGAGGSKADFKADFAIDDSPANTLEMLPLINAYLLDRTWNQDAPALTNRRVLSLPDFYERIT